MSLGPVGQALSHGHSVANQALDAGGFFVIRAKSNTDLRRIYSVPSNREKGIICDQTVALSDFYNQKHYPHHLRRIRFKDPETGETLIFLTNLFAPPPTTICELYKTRWQVELFFKWIKQQLHHCRGGVINARGFREQKECRGGDGLPRKETQWHNSLAWA